MNGPIGADVRLDLAPNGILRVGINTGNPALVRRDPATGEVRGIAVDLARELGTQLGVDVELVTYDAAGKLFDAVRADAWDVAFMAIDRERATELIFTAPYLTIEATYLVPANSPLRAVDDVDRPDVRIAIGAGGAYDLFLTRSLKHAALVRLPTAAAAFDAFLADRLEAAAGVRQALDEFAARHAGLRVLDGRFMAIEQALATPKGRAAGAGFLAAFMDESKSRGFVAEALGRMP